MTRAEYEQRTKQIAAEYDGKARYLRLSVLDESYIASLEKQVGNLSTSLRLADEQIKIKDDLLEQYRSDTDQLKADNLQLMAQIEGRG